MLHGNLAARLSGPTAGGATGYGVEQLSWSTDHERAAFSAGSVNLGLSELVFPSLSLIGAVANGRMGAPLGAEDPSRLGRLQAFMPVRVFDGYARLGSEVTLNINGQDVETRRVEPAPNAPPGDGPYRFEGVNLFSSRMNDVLIRIVAPDGTVEEVRRSVLGSDMLLAPGEFAFVGGFGGRRNPSLDDFAADGQFGGARFNLGLARRLTAGMSAAYQDGLYGADVFFSPVGGTAIPAPSRSAHLGSRLAWQPVDPLLLSTEAARSQSLPDSATDWAVRADAEYQIGELNLHPAVFRYGPRFFDGQNPDQRDLAGATMGLMWRHASGNTFALGGSRTRDNLDDARAEPLLASEILASASVRGIIPRMTLTLGGRRMWIDSDNLQTGLFGVEGLLPSGWSLRGYKEFGDDIRRHLTDRVGGGSTWRFDLPNRMAAAPGVGSAVGLGSVSSAVELWRRIDEDWQVTLAHRNLGTQRRSSLDLVRTAPPGSIWQARLSPGYDWDTQSEFLQDRFELFLSRSRSNRLVLEHQIQQRDWLVRLSFQFQTEVGFAGVRPVPLFESRLDPGSGGVKGRVFLDTNGNGLADSGEPGLAGVEVVTDQGRRTLSTGDGLFVISNSSFLRRTRVSLQPEALPATYTLTQATQEAILRPGEFTEVNLGVAVLGSVSGSLVARVEVDSPSGAREAGVSGVRILLVNEAGQEAGYSITGVDGLFTISDIRPGRYIVRPSKATFPSDFVLESAGIPVEVTSQAEPFERTGLVFTGRYTDPRTVADVQDGDGVMYKVFTPGGASPAPRVPKPSIPDPVGTPLDSDPLPLPLPLPAGPPPEPVTLPPTAHPELPIETQEKPPTEPHVEAAKDEAARDQAPPAEVSAVPPAAVDPAPSPVPAVASAESRAPEAETEVEPEAEAEAEPEPTTEEPIGGSETETLHVDPPRPLQESALGMPPGPPSWGRASCSHMARRFTIRRGKSPRTRRASARSMAPSRSVRTGLSLAHSRSQSTSPAPQTAAIPSSSSWALPASSSSAGSRAEPKSSWSRPRPPSASPSPRAPRSSAAPAAGEICGSSSRRASRAR